MTLNVTLDLTFTFERRGRCRWRWGRWRHRQLPMTSPAAVRGHRVRCRPVSLLYRRKLKFRHWHHWSLMPPPPLLLLLMMMMVSVDLCNQQPTMIQILQTSLLFPTGTHNQVCLGRSVVLLPLMSQPSPAVLQSARRLAPESEWQSSRSVSRSRRQCRLAPCRQGQVRDGWLASPSVVYSLRVCVVQTQQTLYIGYHRVAISTSVLSCIAIVIVFLFAFFFLGFYCPRKRRRYCFQPNEFLSSVNTVTHELTYLRIT